MFAKFLTSRKFIFFFPILLVTIMAIVQASDFGELLQRRERTFDTYNRLQPRDTSNPLPVTVIDIDERSLDEIGQWPWSRDILAELLSALHEHYNVRVIGIDAVFPEYDRSSPNVVAESLTYLGSEELLATLNGLPSHEAQMSKAMEDSNVVMGIIGLDRNETYEDDPHRDLRVESSVSGWIGPNPMESLVDFSTFKGSVPEIEANAKGFGVFSLKLTDEVFRSAPMVVRAGNEFIFPSLALETLRAGQGYSNIVIRAGEEGVQGLTMIGGENEPQTIPTNKAGGLYIYYARPSPYNELNHLGRLYVSAVDVITRELPKERLDQHIVMLGSSAAGLKDLRPTPLSATLPGIEIHANIVENVLSNTFLKSPEDMKVYEFSVTLFGGILVIIIALTLPLVVALFLSASTIALNFYIGWYLFTEQLTLYDPVYSSSSLFVGLIMSVALRYFRDNQEKAFVRRAFQQYLSPKLVDQLTEAPEKLELGGEQREMSILFCDVRGFTKISESFKGDPQGLTNLINRMLTPLSDAILKNQGTIDKYMGDCIMAFWNAPVDDAQHAKHSVISGLKVLEALKEVNTHNLTLDKEQNREHHELAVGVGVNSGQAVVGNMGSQQRFDYSVIGDCVNLASRLEGQTRQYGVDLIIGSETFNLLDEKDFAMVELDKIAVKGKTEPVTIFAVIGDSEKAQLADFSPLKQNQTNFLKAYRSQDFAKAKTIAKKNKNLMNGALELYYDAMLERIVNLTANAPGKGWDGVFVATEK